MVGDAGEAPDHQLVVVGEPVGTVRTVEDMAKRLKSTVLMTESTATLLKERGIELIARGEHTLKGQDVPLALYEWVSNPEGSLSDRGNHNIGVGTDPRRSSRGPGPTWPMSIGWIGAGNSATGFKPLTNSVGLFI